MRAITLSLSCCVFLAAAAGARAGGDPLAALGVGVEWKVVRIAGVEASPGAQATLALTDAGSVAGSSGCNRYVGPIAVQPDGAVRVGPVAVTRMMCDPARMKVEAAFLAALSDVAGVEDGEEGPILVAADGAELAALAR